MSSNQAASHLVLPPVPPEAAGERLDRHIAAQLMHLGDAAPSRSRLKQLIQEGRVKLAGATITDPSRKIKPGEAYSLDLPPAIEAEPAAQDIPLDIAYEDEHLIVVNKPAGLVVHPAPGNPDSTLVNALLHHCGASLKGIGGVLRPGIVHRLDKDTSGLIVAAKTEAAHKGLARLFADHDIERVYHAIVWGLPSPLEGSIEGAIGRDPKDRKRMAIRRQGGKEAMTHYRVARVFRTPKAEPYAALLELELETGRTHQIRVHLTASGHGLIGDPTYGRPRSLAGLKLTPQAEAALRAFPRQALHAAVLGFVHPITNAPLHFEAPWPGDFADLVNALE